MKRTFSDFERREDSPRPEIDDVKAGRIYRGCLEDGKMERSRSGFGRKLSGVILGNAPTGETLRGRQIRETLKNGKLNGNRR